MSTARTINILPPAPNKSTASRSIIRPKEKPVLKVTVLLRLYEKKFIKQ